MKRATKKKLLRIAILVAVAEFLILGGFQAGVFYARCKVNAELRSLLEGDAQ